MLWAFFDPLYLIICGPFLLLGLLTQLVVKGSFAKWSKVGTRSGMTGAQAARAVLSCRCASPPSTTWRTSL